VGDIKLHILDPDKCAESNGQQVALKQSKLHRPEPRVGQPRLENPIVLFFLTFHFFAGGVRKVSEDLVARCPYEGLGWLLRAIDGTRRSTCLHLRLALICSLRQLETLRAVFSINRPLAICLVWCRVGKLSAYDDPSRLSE
jgi:hypothetical protein